MKAQDKDRQRLIKACQELFARTQDMEAVVALLRSSGSDKVSSSAILHDAFGISRRETKHIVHHSKAWSDRYASDEAFHDLVERVARELTPSRRRADDGQSRGPRQKR